MKTLNLLIMTPLLFVCAFLNAQTQSGYVKTLGRPNQKGMPLSGVSVRVRGEHNPVLSNGDGTFSMMMKGKKNGDAYTLQEVKKSAYELNETGIIGRQYAYSDKVPLTIVMVSSAQLQADKQRIENNAYKVAERNYHARLSALEKQKAQNAITEEQYRKELLDLQDKFEKYQQLIDGLAEHYAHVDYDELNDKEREINICIENGELERADSLIKTLFDPIDVLKRNKEALAQLNQQISEASSIIDKANKDMAAVLKQQEKDAEYLYQLYTIALARFDNEKAMKYIEIRTELDTTNVEWQMDAGDIMAFYFSKFNKARMYYERGTRHSLKQNGNNGPVTSRCYLSFAHYYHIMGDDRKALEYYKLAENALKGIEADNPDVYAAKLLIYGQICSTLQAQASVVELYKNALNLILDKYGKESSDAATYWGHLGGAYFAVADYDNSYDAYKECLRIRTSNGAVRTDDLFRAYNHMGLIYKAKGDYVEAESACKKALQGMIRCYGPIHKEIASCYMTLSDISFAQLHYKEALGYIDKAIQVTRALFGDEHIDMANMYDRASSIYLREVNIRKAQEYADKSLEIRKKILDEKSPILAISYQQMASIAFSAQEYGKARTLLKKVWDIFQETGYENRADIARLCNDLGTVCTSLRSYKEAQEYFNQAIRIKKELFGECHQELSITYSNMAEIYAMQGNYDKAIYYYNKTIEIDKATIREENIKAANCYLAIADLWCLKDNNENALRAFQNALKIFCILYGNNSEYTTSLRELIAFFKEQPNMYKEYVMKKFSK